MSQPGSEIVRAHLRRPLWWAGLGVLAVCAASMLEVRARVDDRQWLRAARPVQGTSVGSTARQGDDTEVRYVYPVTEQELSVPVYVWDDGLLPTSEGAPVALLVDADDPGDVSLAGDHYPVQWEPIALWGGVVVGVPLLVAATRLRGQRRVRELMATPGPTFAMLGAIAPYGRLGRRCELHLWPLDARAGAPSLCRVPLLTTGHLPVGGPAFEVEVKGTPRPLGRVVARDRSRGELLVPSGVALVHRARARPDSTAVPVPLPPAQSLAGVVRAPAWWHAATRPLLAVGITGGLLVLVGGLTVSGLRDARALQRGPVAIADVVGIDDWDGSVSVEYQAPEDTVVRYAEISVDYPTDYGVGRRYPVHLDARRRAVRFAREPYDAVEPITWVAIPFAVALGSIVRSLWRWRRVRTTTNGAFRAVETWPVTGSNGVISVVVPHSGQVVASLRVGDSAAARALRLRPARPVLLAGDPQPKGVVALAVDGVLVPTTAKAGAVRALRWWGAPKPSRSWPPPSPERRYA